MITLEIGNSYCRLTGVRPELFKSIRKEFSFQEDAQQAYHRGSFRKTFYMVDARGSFMTGLLTQVADYLYGAGESFDVRDLRKVPKTSASEISIGDKTPYPTQTAAIIKTSSFHRGILSLPTGSGKSLIIAMIVQSKGVKTLIVVPTVELKSQLTETLSAIVDSSLFVVENIASPRLKTLKGFDMLIVDEAHHSAAKTYRSLNKTVWKDIYFRYYMTATPFRNRDSEQMLFEGIAGDVIYELTYGEAVKYGQIVPVDGFFLEVPKTHTVERMWSKVYQQLVVKNQRRNEIISLMALRLLSSEKSVLIMVKEIEHGKILSELTGIDFMHGGDAETRAYLKEFNLGRIRALIGTYGVLGEGVDTVRAEWVIVAGLGKAKSAFMQQVGRGVRPFPGKDSAKIVLIKDGSHKWTASHFNAQKKILLDEYGAPCVRINL